MKRVFMLERMSMGIIRNIPVENMIGEVIIYFWNFSFIYYCSVITIVIVIVIDSEITNMG